MDTIVIGAGLSGLSAAERLARAGRSVPVLEARRRLGGRVLTEPDGGESPIELGPEWFGPEGPVVELLRTADATVTEATGERFDHVHGSFERIPEPSDTVRGLVERIRPLAEPDRPLVQALEECCHAPEYRSARAALLPYVEGYHAADPSRVSTRWLTQVEATQSADASRLRTPDGLQTGVEALAERLRGRVSVRTDTVVREVCWSPGGVTVVANGETLHARTAVVTLPVAILKSSPDHPAHVRFLPELPEKAAALARLGVGHVKKLVLRFTEPFWRRIGPLARALFIQDLDQAFPTWWSAVDPDDPVLVGWAGGPQAARMAGHGRADTVETALDSLAGALGVSRSAVESRLVDVWFHDWSRDPYALGAYSYVLVGGADAHRELAEPVANTLYFAGEAACGQGRNGTMDGPVLSGRRAADDILARTPPEA